MQYKIELYVSGYQDNKNNTSMGVSARLEALRNHHRSWWESMRNWTWQCIELDWNPLVVQISHCSGNVWVQYQYEFLWVTGNGNPTDTGEVKCVSFEKAADGTPIADSWSLSFASMIASQICRRAYCISSELQ